MSYRVEIIENIEGLYSLKKEWDALYLKSYNKENVFLTFEWIVSWTEISSPTIFILVVRNEKGEAQLIAPLAIRRKKKMGMNYRILSFLAFGPTDYHGFIAIKLNDELINIVLKAIKERSSDWDVIELQEIGNADLLTDSLVKSNVFKFLKTNSGPCPRIILKENERFTDKVVKKTKSDVVYQMRRLKKSGTLEFKTITDVSELDMFMTTFFEIHKLRWNSTKTPSKLNGNEGQEIFRKIAEGMFLNGSASYHYLEYNNEVVASNLGFRSGETFYYYLIANNPAYGKNSIGKVYIYMLLDYCTEHNVKVFDFLRGVENYKNDWGTSIQHNYQLAYTKSNFKGLVKWIDLNYVKNDTSRVYKLIKRIQGK